MQSNSADASGYIQDFQGTFSGEAAEPKRQKSGVNWACRGETVTRVDVSNQNIPANPDRENVDSYKRSKSDKSVSSRLVSYVSTITWTKDQLVQFYDVLIEVVKHDESYQSLCSDIVRSVNEMHDEKEFYINWIIKYGGTYSDENRVESITSDQFIGIKSNGCNWFQNTLKERICLLSQVRDTDQTVIQTIERLLQGCFTKAEREEIQKEIIGFAVEKLIDVAGETRKAQLAKTKARVDTEQAARLSPKTADESGVQKKKGKTSSRFKAFEGVAKDMQEKLRSGKERTAKIASIMRNKVVSRLSGGTGLEILDLNGFTPGFLKAVNTAISLVLETDGSGFMPAVSSTPSTPSTSLASGSEDSVAVLSRSGTGGEVRQPDLMVAQSLSGGSPPVYPGFHETLPENGIPAYDVLPLHPEDLECGLPVEIPDQQLDDTADLAENVPVNPAPLAGERSMVFLTSGAEAAAVSPRSSIDDSVSQSGLMVHQSFFDELPPPPPVCPEFYEDVIQPYGDLPPPPEDLECGFPIVISDQQLNSMINLPVEVNDKKGRSGDLMTEIISFNKQGLKPAEIRKNKDKRSDLMSAIRTFQGGELKPAEIRKNKDKRSDLMSSIRTFLRGELKPAEIRKNKDERSDLMSAIRTFQRGELKPAEILTEAKRREGRKSTLQRCLERNYLKFMVSGNQDSESQSSGEEADSESGLTHEENDSH